MSNKNNIEYIEQIHQKDLPTSWEDESLGITMNILRGIYNYGFEKPSPIQSKAIYHMKNMRDIIAQSQSGTGKTAAFIVSALLSIDESKKKTQVLILSPTRELTIQTYEVCKELSSFTSLSIALVIGGQSLDETLEQLSFLPQMIIGSTGRVLDMLKRKKINARDIHLLILDEADELLSSGFKDQIYDIFQFLNQDTQVGLFTATFPYHVELLCNRFMRDPVRLLIKTSQLSLEGIKQFKIVLQHDRHKYDTIKDIFNRISVTQSIIYCNTIQRVEQLTKRMNNDYFSVIDIHSNMDNKERISRLEEFKSGKARVLISSDITSRGIDIQQVSVVINYDIPYSKHNYLHRIGRSGRWGRKGIAINFVVPRDQSKLKTIEKHYKIEIEDMPNDFMEHVI